MNSEIEEFPVHGDSLWELLLNDITKLIKYRMKVKICVVKSAPTYLLI